MTRVSFCFGRRDFFDISGGCCVQWNWASGMARESKSVDLRIAVEGPLNKLTVAHHHEVTSKQMGMVGPDVIVALDLSSVTEMDSAGAAWCYVLFERVRRRGGRLVIDGISEQARKALSVFRVHPDLQVSEKKRGTWLEVVGEGLYRVALSTVDFCVLAADTLYFAVEGLFRRDRRRVRGGAVVEQMVRIGLESLGIIALISLLVGLTVALQSAYQLRQFGANIFIANLVGVAMTREMGPLMTAILLAGRSGASIAAEISTMVVTEEVDALRVMGIHPVRFLVVPRFYGITLTQPLLTVVSDTLGIFGGLLVAVLYLQIGAQAFMNQLLEALQVKDLITGLVKSVAFAWIIVFSAAHRGFRAKGGPEGVGFATTASVVQTIFLVIAADAFFSLVFYFGD